MFELHMDRRLFLFDSWRTMAAALVAPLTRSKPFQIEVPRMSEAWLREHEAEPLHGDPDR
jgi:hypothetical protein